MISEAFVYYKPPGCSKPGAAVRHVTFAPSLENDRDEMLRYVCASAVFSFNQLAHQAHPDTPDRQMPSHDVADYRLRQIDRGGEGSVHRDGRAWEGGNWWSFELILTRNKELAH